MNYFEDQYEQGALKVAQQERDENDAYEDYLDAVQFGPVPDED